MSNTIVNEEGVITVTVYEAGITITGGRLMVGDVEILKKGDGNEDDGAVQNGDLILFYDSENQDRRVEGVVTDAENFAYYDIDEETYPNLRLYGNTVPSN